MVIDNTILDNLTAQAKASPRLRMNLNFHQSLDEKCHRFLNAVEPGANIPVHRHPEKEESFVVLRGRIRVITYNDDGTIIENIVLNPSEGRYGVNVGKNVWHTVEALEPGSVIFECKEGPYVPHEEEGILVVDNYEGLGNGCGDLREFVLAEVEINLHKNINSYGRNYIYKERIRRIS